MRGLLLIVAGILLVAGLWFLNDRLPARPQPDADAGDPNANANGQGENDPRRGTASTDDSGVSASGNAARGVGAQSESEPSNAAATVVRVWEEWPQPDVALMITGEQHGYFEPCGCTANQMGGMARRADLYNKLTAAGWDVRGIDLGGLAQRTGRQSQIKYETSLRALRDLQYVAVGLGPEDLRLQPDFLITQDDPTDDDSALRFVSANLVFFDSPELGTPVPTRVVDVGNHRIGITSVMTESTQADVAPAGVNLNFTWSDPKPALQKVLEEFDSQQVSLRILLSHGTPEDTREMLADFPQFDVVVLAQGFGDPSPKQASETVGDTLYLQVGHKGKYAGVLGIYPSDSETSVRFQLIPLERSEFDDTENMVAFMSEYQQQLEEEQIVLTAGDHAHPSGASFVGAAKCGECHTTAYEIWEQTPHAHALESLDPANERKGFERLNGVARMHDPECLSCHVTGWDPQEYLRFRSGFLNEEFAQTEDERLLHTLLAGNQCENCHGPGSRHVELMENGGDLVLARREVRVTIEQVEDTCYKCHDADNSPHFEFDEYWSQVEHYGMD